MRSALPTLWWSRRCKLAASTTPSSARTNRAIRVHLNINGGAATATLLPIPMSALTCGPASLLASLPCYLPCDFCPPPPEVSLIITYIMPLPPASAWLEEPTGTEAA